MKKYHTKSIVVFYLSAIIFGVYSGSKVFANTDSVLTKVVVKYTYFYILEYISISCSKFEETVSEGKKPSIIVFKNKVKLKAIDSLCKKLGIIDNRYTPDVRIKIYFYYRVGSKKFIETMCVGGRVVTFKGNTYLFNKSSNLLAYIWKDLYGDLRTPKFK